MKWSDDQSKVIQLRNRNILVSAAAGSGKTAVLVQRIIKMITEEGVDIDELLVVTFTNKAAAEMRERISAGIAKCIEADPDNLHLRRQSSLIHNAKISTIHSFCQSIIMNYFYRIDVEPGFRIGDENEMTLIRADVMDDLLESWYSKNDTNFIELVDKYTSDKDDSNLASHIEELYKFSESYPWPAEWLEHCRAVYDINSEAELYETDWFKSMLDNTRAELKEALLIAHEIMDMCESGGISERQYALIAAEADFIESICDVANYNEVNIRIHNFEFIKWPTLLKAEIENGLDREYASAVNKERVKYKKIVTDLRDSVFVDTKIILEQIRLSKDVVNTLIDLTIEFGERFSAEKRRQNVMDFSDLEHYALQILCNPDTPEHEPTEVALECRGLYKQIMIDEYQDSNGVQESILTSISENNNLFMVGDVKQSIYGFRMADPSLFMHKYDTYSEEDSDNQKILLSQNFRSRTTVLDSVNAIFSRLMQYDMGGIEYDDKVALHKGPLYDSDEVAAAAADKKTEILITDKSDDKFTSEAAMVAERINEMVNGIEPMYVFDKDAEAMRPIRYSDIAIIMRGIKDSADTFVSTLKSAGVPAFAQSSTGYFQTYEVRLLLDFLTIIDNPRQDIPLAAVLTSVIYGFTDEDLVHIRECMDKGRRFYDALKSYCENGSDEKLRARANAFTRDLDDFRSRSVYMQIHELLEYIFEKTRYDKLLTAMPAGRQRQANIERLYEYAVAFEKTNYRGLFQFNRYIENLQTYEVDYGEADAVGEGENAVAILTIHKSKGLEYPVVFVCALGKQFNDTDLHKKIIFHMEMGIGTDVMDTKRRIRCKTLMKRALSTRKKFESRAEEERILYVAMTRAREKLILTMELKADDRKKLMGSFNYGNMDAGIPLRRNEVLGANGYYNWIFAATNNNTDHFDIRYVPAADVADAEAADITKARLSRDMLLSISRSVSPDVISTISSRFQDNAIASADTIIPAKLSVSDIKLDALSHVDEEAYEAFETPEKELYIPDFARAGDKASNVNKGALRGTAFHRVMECLDFCRDYDYGALKDAITAMVESGRMDKESADMVYVKAVSAFTSSRLYERMKQAALLGRLYKEAPFVMGIPAREANSEYDSDERILVQGIIDAYFEEEDGIVLVDYKTDRTESEQELIDHYRRQMELYAYALEHGTGKKVKEIYLYSFSLNKEISIAL